MALVDLSTGYKKAIVVMALAAIIALKIIGLFSTRMTIFMALALAGVGIITDPSPTANDTLQGKAVTA
jgi:hypothetical protein